MNRSIILGAIIISAAILVNGILERRAHVPSPVSSAPSTSITLPDQSIAVLPFTSLDSAESALAAGLQQQIIAQLTAKNVKAANTRETPPTGEFLQGSVQRAGPRIRVTVQLVDATSKIPRWAETYDREVTDVLALESEIAAKVAESIAAKKS